ncbi:Protein of unknown function [Desulfonispora thiosulfatigenes DSM 11270]|uniref:DUF3243 domain-containing protein n=1 Tax=Desulfonispora thiosulfatigenes DSM 11270 TaxID=656914 RepID=A0A1W1V8G3_DESTI|nr:DUF3243 family protein [Desulfonispora thiosulfatigenes]SMB89294.1 Protein of unknown function [Desulfonispora thiosulfatigenes DSM 11270]
MFNNKKGLGLDDFPEEVQDVIKDGKKHGVTDEMMSKGMVSIGNMMAKFVKPDSPEEALIKEMWQVADDEEKSTMANLVLKVGKDK